VFVDLGGAPRYWIVPDRWIRNDIHEAHQQYLNKHGGHRAENHSSKHHAIDESRLENWQNKWDILGIFGGGGYVFQLGASYTREQIHAQIGGSLQSYLPHVGGRVVAACLRLDTNPDAPAVILAGMGDGIENAAELLVAQDSPVPTFLKRDTGNWEYVGDFRVERWSQDAAELAEQARRSGRDDLTRVIHMARSHAPLPWLYTIAEGVGRTFDIEGATIPVTILSYRQLVENGRLVEDRWWRISQHWEQVAIGDEVFIYTGEQDLGIIGYAKIKSVEKRSQGWCLEPEFDLSKCRMLLRHPIPASVVRGWNLNLRRNPVNLNALASELYSLVPWRAVRPPEEVQEGSAYREGSVQRILVNRYERDPQAREDCIKHYGPTCVVCGFNFGAVYGPLAEGFIHVHHVKSLSEIGEEYVVDPVADLRPVCPNCHAVLHLGGECRRIEEVSQLLELGMTPNKLLQQAAAHHVGSTMTSSQGGGG
jgi:hypothetical protein